MVYAIILIILLFGVYFEINGFIKKDPNLDILYYFILIILICLSGFRYRVGGDSLSYFMMFPELPSLAELRHFDFINAKYNPLWYVFNGIAKVIYNDFTTFQFLHAILVNSTIFWFVKKYSSKKYLLITAYFIFSFPYYNMEILRESLAISVFLISVPFILKRDWKRYYFFCVIALLFHTSAIILFFLPFFFRPIKKIYLIIAGVITIFFSFIDLYSFVEILPLPSQISDKFNSYLTKEINIYGKIMQSLLFLPPVVFYFIRKRMAIQHALDNFIFVTLIFGTLSMVIGGAYRILNYFLIINLVYSIDTILLVLPRRFNFLVPLKAFAVSCMLFYQFYYYYRDMSDRFPDTRFYMLYYPYHSVINPKIEENRERMYYNIMYMDYHRQNVL